MPQHTSRLYFIIFILTSTLVTALPPPSQLNNGQPRPRSGSGDSTILKPMTTAFDLFCRVSSSEQRLCSLRDGDNETNEDGAPVVYVANVNTCRSICSYDNISNELTCRNFRDCDGKAMDSFCNSLCTCSTKSRAIVKGVYNLADAEEDEDDDDGDGDDDDDNEVYEDEEEPL